jgi:hypothetical protein
MNLADKILMRPVGRAGALCQQERTWRSKPAYRTEAEMAEDFRDAGVRVILDFGYPKYLPIEEAHRIHDYGFTTQQAYPDVIIGNWVHFPQPNKFRLSLQVDVIDPVPALLGGLDRTADFDDPDIVVQHVDPTERRDAGVDHGSDVVGTRHVPGDRLADAALPAWSRRQHRG